MLSTGSSARFSESRSSEDGQLLVFRNLKTSPAELIVSISRTDNDEAVGTRSKQTDLLLAARPGGYIAIAARKFGLCGTGTLILPETLGEAGLVMM